jgi:hypothetical protein
MCSKPSNKTYSDTNTSSVPLAKPIKSSYLSYLHGVVSGTDRD